MVLEQNPDGEDLIDAILINSGLSTEDIKPLRRMILDERKLEAQILAIGGVKEICDDGTMLGAMCD